MLTRTLTAIAALCLGLALVACSDDGEEKPLDGGKLDTTQVLDTGKTDDVYDPDTTSPDQAIVPDKAVPDADPGQPSKWKEMLSGTTGALKTVWAIDSKNVYAGGKGGLLMKYDGSSWTNATNPDTDKAGLTAMHESGSNLIAVGSGVDLFYNGTTWAEGYSKTASTYSLYNLTGLWSASTATNLWAVEESSSTYSMYIRYRSKSATTTSWSYSYKSGLSGGQSNYAIWGTSDTDLYVVGDGGKIHNCTTSCTSTSSGGWTAMTSLTTSNLRGIWGSSNKDIFVVGYDGVILHYDGTTWKKVTSGTSSYFQSVWGSGPKDVYAVAHPIFKSDESIFHYDGTSWTKMPTPHTSYLNAVRGTSASDVWAVGNTHILHYDGK
jgi:hypothetical protein